VRRNGDIVGYIRWSGFGDSFYIPCKVESHNRHKQCSVSRKYTPFPTPSRRQWQGRPLGFLAAWMIKADMYTSQPMHVSLCKPSYEERCNARAALMLEPAAQEFLNLERPKHGGEGDEPLVYQ
jgi:hypothetical protein